MNGLELLMLLCPMLAAFVLRFSEDEGITIIRPDEDTTPEGDEPPEDEDAQPGDEPETPEDDDSEDEDDEDAATAYQRGRADALAEMNTKGDTPGEEDAPEDIEAEIAKLQADYKELTFDEYDDADEKVAVLQKRQDLRDRIDELRDKRQKIEADKLQEEADRDAYDKLLVEFAKHPEIGVGRKNELHQRVRTAMKREGYSGNRLPSAAEFRQLVRAEAAEMRLEGVKSPKDGKPKPNTKGAGPSNPAAAVFKDIKPGSARTVRRQFAQKGL